MASQAAEQSSEHLVIDTTVKNGDHAHRLQAGPAVARSPSVAFDKTLDDNLKLDTHELTLDGKNLIVIDRAARKRQRSCFPSSEPAGRLTIPLHNVLWASHTPEQTSLTIKYAAPLPKDNFRATTLTIPISNTEDLLPGAIPSWTSALLSRAYGPAQRRRRAYVLINPKSGPGGSVKKFETEVRPIFDAAQMELEVVITTHARHALDLAEKLDISKYDIIVVCGGDGGPHEVINGFARRPDARIALQTVALAHVPCGSGNGMAMNLYGAKLPSKAALGIAKGVVTPMDLVSVTQGPRRYLSFLSQAVGIMADLDLATEHLRWMGEGRFVWGFLERFITKKSYPCDLAVKVEIATKDGVKEHFARERTKELERDPMNGVTNRAESHGETPDSTSTAIEDEGLPPLKYGTINDKLPDGWELLPYDNLGNFFCGNMSWMASTFNFFPGSFINDGLMDLMTVNSDIPVVKSFGLFAGLESGATFDMPHMTYRKISAYRIIPRDQKKGYISIDGEGIPFEPFQAEVHKGLLRCITTNGRYESPGPKGWEKVARDKTD